MAKTLRDDQQEFWDNLTLPANRTCFNCKHWNHGTTYCENKDIMVSKCKTHYKTFTELYNSLITVAGGKRKRKLNDMKFLSTDYWEWNGKTY